MMEILKDVNAILGSKKKGDKWVIEALPVICDVNREIKSLEKKQDEESEPFKLQVREIKEKYAPALKPLNEIDSRLRERIMDEHDTSDSIKVDGQGELVFAESWTYTIVDFKKVPKELKIEAIDDKQIKASIKAGVRNIPGLKIEKSRSLRVLTKVEP